MIKNRVCLRIKIVAVFIFLSIIPVISQHRSHSGAIVIPKLKSEPKLSYFISMKPLGNIAKKMIKVTGFIQKEPEDGKPATEKTEVYLGYDTNRIYIVFVAFDSDPKKIRARMNRRENIWGDDMVEIMLDTFNDQRHAYVFISNPFGIQMDAIWTEGQHFDRSFDTVWDSYGAVTDKGYVVMFSIPFKSLRFPHSGGKAWGIILNRTIPRLNENDFWPYVTNRIEGRLNQEAKLVGLDDISPSRNIQFIPYGVYRAVKTLNEDLPGGPDFVTDWSDTRLGLDAKWVLRDRFVVDMALNPDFSQIESDSPQVTVNRRFEVYYPEKRPFFTENAGYFRTPFDLLFTRRIKDPKVGVRVTGKLGSYAVGALIADDKSPGEEVDQTDSSSYGEKAWFGVVRVNKDLWNQSTIGFIFTNRKFQDTFNRVGGIDGRFKLGDNWITSFQAVTSSTRLSDGNTQAGPAYMFYTGREGRNLNFDFSYVDISPGFLTEAGFVNRVDFRRIDGNFAYKFWPERSRIISWGPEFSCLTMWDHNGQKLESSFRTSLSFALRGQTSAYLGVHLKREWLRPEDFSILQDNKRYFRPSYFLLFRSNYFATFGFHFNYSWGKSINYIPTDDQAPALAKSSSASVGITYHPKDNIRWDNTYLFSSLKSRQEGSPTIFNNHIFRSRWNWQFDKELSFRVILQYETVISNPFFTDLSNRRNLNADLLVTYLVHPGTAIYVGFNTNARNVDLIRGPYGNEITNTSSLSTIDGKQFFLKISYLFRM